MQLGYTQPTFAVEPRKPDQWAKYTPDEMSKFEAYYGAPPSLLEGFKYIKNAECKQFLAELSETDTDLTHNQPVRASLPYASVRVGEGTAYKVRALLDSGSTNTLVSLALLEQMP